MKVNKNETCYFTAKMDTLKYLVKYLHIPLSFSDAFLKFFVSLWICSQFIVIFQLLLIKNTYLGLRNSLFNFNCYEDSNYRVINRNQFFVLESETNDWFLYETQHWAEWFKEAFEVSQRTAKIITLCNYFWKNFCRHQNWRRQVFPSVLKNSRPGWNINSNKTNYINILIN